MSMLKIVFLYLLTVPVFFVIDMTWLGLVAKNFYRSQLGSLMRTDIIWSAAILFYFLFILGIILFAVMPAISAGSWVKALTLGAMFGFFTYMTYDLTNYATLKDFPFAIVIPDIIWGTVLSGTVATASFFISRFIA